VTPRPAPPPDLAGRWLSKFFTGHLAGERAASPRTVASYRDAMKLLLTWFRDAERIPPEKLRLADIDRPRVLRFLDWLEAERNCSAATRNQRLAVIKSFCRYTAVEQPGHLDQVTQVLAIRQKNSRHTSAELIASSPASSSVSAWTVPQMMPCQRENDTCMCHAGFSRIERLPQSRSPTPVPMMSSGLISSQLTSWPARPLSHSWPRPATPSAACGPAGCPAPGCTPSRTPWRHRPRPRTSPPRHVPRLSPRRHRPAETTRPASPARRPWSCPCSSRPSRPRLHREPAGTRLPEGRRRKSRI
jgi:hypothetical protein